MRTWKKRLKILFGYLDKKIKDNFWLLSSQVVSDSQRVARSAHGALRAPRVSRSFSQRKSFCVKGMNMGPARGRILSALRVPRSFARPCIDSTFLPTKIVGCVEPTQMHANKIRLWYNSTTVCLFQWKRKRLTLAIFENKIVKSELPLPPTTP